MVELRWVESGDGHDDDPIRRVLEYREVPPCGPPLPGGTPPYEWKEVPVVNWRDAK